MTVRPLEKWRALCTPLGHRRMTLAQTDRFHRNFPVGAGALRGAADRAPAERMRPRRSSRARGGASTVYRVSERGETLALRPLKSVGGESHQREKDGVAAVIAIFALKDGDEVDGLLACDRKAIVCRMNGQSSFLVVGLRDGYNSIEARAYADVDRLASRFDRGDIVRVRGKANGHGGALQLRVRDIARSDGGWPTVALRTRDVDELDGFLEHLAEEHAGRY